MQNCRNFAFFRFWVTKCKQNFDFLHFTTFSRQPNALKKSKENTTKQKESTKTKVFEENKKGESKGKAHSKVRGNGCGGAWSEVNTTLEKRSDGSAWEASSRGAVTADLRREEEAIDAENEKVTVHKQSLSPLFNQTKTLTKRTAAGEVLLCVAFESMRRPMKKKYVWFYFIFQNFKMPKNRADLLMRTQRSLSLSLSLPALLLSSLSLSLLRRIKKLRLVAYSRQYPLLSSQRIEEIFTVDEVGPEKGPSWRVWFAKLRWDW